LLLRETIYYGATEINADTEFFHDSIEGMQVVLPYSDRWRKIIVQVSGGLDSAILLYLFAKKLEQIGSKVQIQPLSLEIPTKAKTLSTARAVINKVRDLTKYAHLLPGLEVAMPMEDALPPHKDIFFKTVIRKLRESGEYDFEFNGNTKNPPQEVRETFRDDEFRQQVRDNRTTIYNSPNSASPNAFVNKRGIIHIFRTEGILEELAPLTMSCDMDLEEIEARNLPLPCGECWWCRERDWGFRSSQLDSARA
jgi:hypothetical protein